MAGLFSKFTTGLTSPAKNAAEVVPNNSVDLTTYSRGLIIGVAGTIKVDTVGGNTVTITAVAGILPIRVKRVYATGTSASNIVAIW